MKIFMVLDHYVDYFPKKGLLHELVHVVLHDSNRIYENFSAYLPVTFGKVKDSAEIQLG